MNGVLNVADDDVQEFLGKVAHFFFLQCLRVVFVQHLHWPVIFGHRYAGTVKA